MAYEDFTTFTEVDPNSHISTTATRVTYAGLARNEVAYLYKDYGAGYFQMGMGIEGVFNIQSVGGAAGAKSAGICFADAPSTTQEAARDQAICFHKVETDNTTVHSDYAYLINNGTAVGYGNGSGTHTLALNTSYAYQLGLITSVGGQYGALMCVVFTDTTKTAISSVSIQAFTVATTYQYLVAAQPYNGGVTSSITGYDENVSIVSFAAGIDLTTATGGFTQTDPSAHIADYADCIVVTTLNTNENAYHYKDYGASYFNGNYILTGALNVTAFATGSGTMLTLLSLMNAITDGNGTEDKHCVILDYVSSSTYTLKAREVSGATGYNSSASSTLNTNQPYWIKAWRDTSVGTYGTLYLAVYNDPTMLSQVGSTLSLALHDNGTPDVAAFQYFYPLQSWNTGSSRTTTFTFGGVSAVKTVGGTLAGDIVTTASFVGSGGAVSTLEGSVVTTASFIGASVNDGVLAGTSVVTASFVGELFSAGSANLNGNVVVAASFVGASVAEGALAGNAVTTCSFVADTTPSLTATITCRITKVNSAGQEIGATGLTPTLKFYLVSNSYYRDFSDSAFKPIASCVTLTANMTERNSTLAPGRYDYTLQTYGLGSGAKTEYGYDIDATISSSETYMNEGSMIFLDGIEVLPGLTVAENTTLNVIPSAAQIATEVNALTVGQFLALK